MGDFDEIRNDLTAATQKLNAAATSLENLGKSFKGILKNFDKGSKVDKKRSKMQLRLLKDIKDAIKTGDVGGGGGGIGGGSDDVVAAVQSLQKEYERGSVEATLQESYDAAFKLTKNLERGFAGMARSKGVEEAYEKQLEAIEVGLKQDKFVELGEDGFKKWEKTLESDKKERQKFDDQIRAQAESFRRDQDRHFISRMGGVVTIPLNKFVQYLGKVFTRAFEIQDASLKFNRTFNETMQHSSEKIANLPGGLATRLDALFAFQAQGLDQLGATSMNLATRMRLTGQDMGALISVQKNLITMGALSRDETEKLASTLLNTSISQNVAIDRLIAGLDQLKASLTTFALGGTTGEVTNAIAELSADFPGMSEQIGAFVDKLATSDISQAGVLGAIPDLEAITSGAIQSGDQLRAVISRLSTGAYKFTQGFKNLNIGAKKAVEAIVGDLGAMAQKLDQNLLDFVATAKGSTDRILTSLRVAVDEALFPFEEALTSTITKLASFGKHLANFSKKMDSMSGGFLGMDRLIPAIVGALLLKRAFPGVSKIAGRTGGNWFVVAFRSFTKIFKKGFFSGLLRIGSKFLGPVGVILLALEAIAFFTGESEKEQRSSKEKLDELVNIEKERERREREKGSSRFERLTLKIIQDSLLQRTLMEGITSQQLGRLIEVNEETRDATRKPPTPTTVSIPVR